jgi:hypothetical protein
VAPIAVQGRASTWQDHLSLTYGGAGGSSAAGPAPVAERDSLAGADVVRIFEGRLADALLGEDGSLSLGTLASNTFSTLLPKIETQGQLGRAR